MTVKESVLSILHQHIGQPISGTEVASSLHISRNAVWKAVSALKAEGYPIEAATNRGYVLTKAVDVVSAALITEELSTREIGRSIEVFGELPSTNDYAKMRAAKGAVHGTVIIADNQPLGRGRKGRSFYSPKNSGIYMSIVLRPDFDVETAGTLTCLAAVAAAEAVEQVSGLQIGIKWVNDLFCDGKKLCGILTEAVMDLESGGLESMVVGIGINVAKMEFPPEVADVAASVSNLCGREISRNHLAGCILNRFEERLDRIETRDFIEDYRRRSVLTGKEVTVYGGRESYSALVTGIDDWGHLIVRTPTGEQHLNSGEVSVKPQPEA